MSAQLINRIAAHHRGRPERPAAFTLVEILVVVVILGIAAAVIVPQMGSRDDLKAAAAARMIMADLIYAQNKAISTQTRHYVKFDTTTPQTYRLLSSMNPETDIQQPVTKASTYTVKFGRNAPADTNGITPGMEQCGLGTINIEGHTNIGFDELGVPCYWDTATNKAVSLTVSGGSSIQVTCGTFTLTVSIEPYTGEIKVN